MLVHETPLEGAALIELEAAEDERGFFARSFCRGEFEAAGLEPVVEQCNLSFNHRKGTLRGFHYQLAPNAEAKTIRCTRGAVYDVIVDLRPDSPTYLAHFGAALTAENRLAMHVPRNFGHAYLTLTDDAETFYQVSAAYTAGAERGLRWDDPVLGVQWPAAVELVSAKDASWPLLTGTARLPHADGAPLSSR
ncbi:dTDP-4-dehydrorhamnose 3,5-epimerase family protein [Streptomyces antarcticus]|uniref:dTDP-4-dehydrorhamnose 3,5-epimerase family protein n=1 Tax=Streptomyces antarcticus TaxID=2996458 RepID=UPI00226DB4AC|nr:MULTISPECIES: dTDP-4-dehydrorhamnose 3,5-epimerase family protein [unclassified Streptomyces]MCY0945758.1 dTDP-4-dehydrorhamnose 3,5-epimerase family protein [Streptomyces sp. H34-AA3]MCZ4084080.1 dTDP-4-dehydrorhamnose 3,5-epimerase family protein [Streptomyces sp. H34-S5]